MLGGSRMAKAKNALVKKAAADLIEAPAYLQQKEAPLGMENMRPEDMLIPRVVLMQALSPSVVEGSNRPGELVNSLSREVIVGVDDSPMAFIPIFHYLEWIKWGDREKNEGMLDRSLDGDGALAMSAMRGERLQRGGKDVMVVTEYHNFICLMPEISLVAPIMIGCCRTNHKKGKQLLTLSKYRGKYDLFAGRYTITSTDEKNKVGQQYKVFNFENAGWSTEDENSLASKLYPGVKEAYDNRALKVDDDTGQDNLERSAADETEL